MLIRRSNKHSTCMISCYAAEYQDGSYQQGNAHDCYQKAKHYYLPEHAAIHIVLLSFLKLMIFGLLELNPNDARRGQLLVPSQVSI